MFALVKDVETYPDFLPWCQSTQILKATENEICAELVVARLGIRQSFATCNAFVENERMDLVLKDGPFRKLRGHWQFVALRKGACKVELNLEFEFSGALIDRAFGSFFHHAANTLVDAFCKRANEVYGG